MPCQGEAGCRSPEAWGRLGTGAVSSGAAASGARAAMQRPAIPDETLDTSPSSTGGDAARPGRRSSLRVRRAVAQGRRGMVGALTREEAEEKHRTRQHYALATRLPDGHLLVVRHYTGWSPHDPE